MKVITSCDYQGKHWVLAQLKDIKIIYTKINDDLYQVRKENSIFGEYLNLEEFNALTNQPNFELKEILPFLGDKDNPPKKLNKPKELKGIKQFHSISRKFRGQTIFSTQLFEKDGDLWVKDRYYATLVEKVDAMRMPKNNHNQLSDNFPVRNKYYNVPAWLHYEGIGYLKQMYSHIVDFLNVVRKTYFGEDGDAYAKFSYVQEVFESYYKK